VGQRLLADSVLIRGRRILPDRLYTVTADQAVAVMLPSLGVTIQDLQVASETEYEVLRDFVRRLAIVSYGSQARVRDVAARR
jgi:hypothetical protein